MADLEFQIERTLTFKHSGKRKQGKVKIGGIRFVADQQKWACRVSIDYLFPESAWLHGDDPLDAFRLCLLFSSDAILGCAEKGWSIWWHREGDHGGFFYYTR